MKKYALIIFILTFPLHFTLHAQSPPLQYEDEAPLGTWNIFGFLSARNLGMGNTAIANSSESSASLFNPALLANLKSFKASITLFAQTSEMFRYSLINTSSIRSSKLGISIFDVGSAGFIFPYKGFTYGVNYFFFESYERPDFVVPYPGQPLNGEFSGNARGINLSVSREIISDLSLGISFNYIAGKRYLKISEEFGSGTSYFDEKSHDLYGWNLGIGFFYRTPFNLNVGASIKSPLRIKTDSEILREFKSPVIEIFQKDTSKDETKKPFLAGLGFSYFLRKNILISSDFIYFPWKKYEYFYFGEKVERNFKSVIEICIGGEYSLLFPKESLHLRIGYFYDPQPLRKTEINYNNFTFGAGVSLGKFRIDGAYSTGSATDVEKISSKKFLISIVYFSGVNDEKD
ncbi:MAG: hypothetical protein AB1410_05400 [Acidobacteriota bacterium]